MRELWAKRIALITGALVVVLAALFASSQNPNEQQASPTPIAEPGTAYVGSAVCGRCHAKEYQAWSQSGHAFMLNAVIDGKPPHYPFTRVPQPPAGYQWQDIRYVVGGYHWKARFVDQRGNLLTGEASQYNLANPYLKKQAGWVPYEADKRDKPFDCGNCHTTGFQPEAVQDDLPAIKGAWAEAGIGCENCHGPGRQHAKQPTSKMRTDRSSDFCGTCHLREPLQDVAMAKGFVRHHQQFNAQRHSKHARLSCNDCHDPHKGVIAELKAARPAVRKECGACHQAVVRVMTVKPKHRALACIDCHMPRLDVTAWSDAARYSGDMRTHLFAIDPDATSQTLDKGGKAVSITGITLDFACRTCHRRDGPAVELTQIELHKFAKGIHAQP